MSASEGNTNAMKFKTPEERQKVAQDYDIHCSKGLSDEAFYIDPETLKRYIADFSVDFGTVEESRRKRRLFWETVGIDGMMGKINRFSSSTWSFNMKNRYGWKEQSESKGDNKGMTLVDLVSRYSIDLSANP